MQKSCVYKSTKALRRLCRSFHLKITGTSCTEYARVKVPSFLKVTFFYNIEYYTETPFICIFVCLEVFLTAMIKDEQASNDLFQSDSLFCYVIA